MMQYLDFFMKAVLKGSGPLAHVVHTNYRPLLDADPTIASWSENVIDVLEGRVISTVHVTSDQECQMKCILSEICDSFNLGPQTASRLYPCEILDQRSSRKVIKREQWKFRARWVSG